MDLVTLDAVDFAPDFGLGAGLANSLNTGMYNFLWYQILIVYIHTWPVY